MPHDRPYSNRNLGKASGKTKQVVKDDSKEMKQPVKHEGRLDDKTKGQIIGRLAKSKDKK